MNKCFQAIILLLTISPLFLSISLARQLSNASADARTLERKKAISRDLKSEEAYRSQIPITAEQVKTDAVTKWLKANRIPLRRVEAGVGFSDLQPLKKVLNGVRIVGLGEATHGSREFFQFKHRMLEFLVKEMGFRVFAIEASYVACFNINDYVMGRTTDGAKALDSQGFWTWNTNEVRDMLEWMRSYNQSVSLDKKIKFVGYDIQVNKQAEEVVLAYLRKVAPERAGGAEALFKTNFAEAVGKAATGSEQEKTEALAKLADIRSKYFELVGYFALNELKFTIRSSASEFTRALQHARVLAQYVDAYGRTGNESNPESTRPALRDYYMADNIGRLLKVEPGARMVVWAHNAHISTGDGGGRYPRMGWHLRRTYGAAYYAIGFSFNQGAFQSRDLDPKAKRALTEFRVGPAPEGSLDWYLAHVGTGNYFVDLRHTPKNEVVSEWLATAHPMRSVGSGYSIAGANNSFVPTILKQEFDGLVFFEKTTRARPNPSVPNR